MGYVHPDQAQVALEVQDWALLERHGRRICWIWLLPASLQHKRGHNPRIQREQGVPPPGPCKAQTGIPMLIPPNLTSLHYLLTSGLDRSALFWKAAKIFQESMKLTGDCEIEPTVMATLVLRRIPAGIVSPTASL